MTVDEPKQKEPDYQTLCPELCKSGDCSVCKATEEQRQFCYEGFKRGGLSDSEARGTVWNTKKVKP